MKRKGLMPRRSFIRGAGGVTLALPVLDSMLPLTGFGRRRALAQDVAPRRVIIFNWGNGIPSEHWVEAQRQFDAVRDKTLFISGVPIAAWNDGSAFAHSAGAQAVLTGSSNDRGAPASDANAPAAWARTDSIDVFLEEHSRAANLPFPAYRAMAFPQVIGFPDPQARRVCVRDRADIPLQTNPTAMYQELFAGRSFSSGSDAPAVPSGPSPQAAADLRVLDATSEATRNLRTRLDASSKRRLEGYLDGLSEIERSLNAAGGVASAQCADPGATDLRETRNPPQIRQVADAQIDMLAMAIACDLTRVGFFQVTGSGGGAPYDDINYGNLLGTQSHLSGHHMNTHNWNSAGQGSEKSRRLSEIGETVNYLFGVAARLAEKLDSFPEGDGTVLDHTVIYMVTETVGADDSNGFGGIHGQTGHAMRNIIIGGTDYFDLGGREVQFGGQASFARKTNPQAIDIQDPNPTNNRLLLHLFRFMGDGRETFGENPDYSQGGPLNGLAK